MSLFPVRPDAGSREEDVHGTDCVDVMHPYDPLSPREVLDTRTHVSRLPVEDPGNRVGIDVEQHVLGSEVAVHEHRTGSHEAADAVGWQGLQGSKRAAHAIKHPGRVAYAGTVPRQSVRAFGREPEVLH